MGTLTRLTAQWFRFGHKAAEGVLMAHSSINVCKEEVANSCLLVSGLIEVLCSLHAVRMC